MLDLETMGNGGNAAIIAIGAVRFDKEVTDKFYEVVTLQSSIDAGLEMDASTVMWWMDQTKEARDQFKRDGVTLQTALMRFGNWAGEDAEVWGNGASFDNSILSNAYRKCGLAQPWYFWNDRCYRTVKSMNTSIKLKRVGTYHNAVDDAESQALHLIEILSV
jgi:exodeoxyribonuclease VIII